MSHEFAASSASTWACAHRGHRGPSALHQGPGRAGGHAPPCALNHKVFGQIQDFLRPGITEKPWPGRSRSSTHPGRKRPVLRHHRGLRAQRGAAQRHPRRRRAGRQQPRAAGQGLPPGRLLLGPDADLLGRRRAAEHFARALERTKEGGGLLRLGPPQAAGIAAIAPGCPSPGPTRRPGPCVEGYGVGRAFHPRPGPRHRPETHEAPSLGPKATGVFEPGMIITVEPGLVTLPQWGGIRWEYMVLVTEGRARGSVSPAP